MSNLNDLAQERYRVSITTDYTRNSLKYVRMITLNI